MLVPVETAHELPVDLRLLTAAVHQLGHGCDSFLLVCPQSSHTIHRVAHVSGPIHRSRATVCSHLLTQVIEAVQSCLACDVPHSTAIA